MRFRTFATLTGVLLFGIFGVGVPLIVGSDEEAARARYRDTFDVVAVVLGVGIAVVYQKRAADLGAMRDLYRQWLSARTWVWEAANEFVVGATGRQAREAWRDHMSQTSDLPLVGSIPETLDEMEEARNVGNSLHAALREVGGCEGQAAAVRVWPRAHIAETMRLLSEMSEKRRDVGPEEAEDLQRRVSAEITAVCEWYHAWLRT
jgi:hypothetical protein